MIFGELAIARRNLLQSEEARSVLGRLRKRVSPWLAMPEEDLPKMVPSPSVPRAFNTSFNGCPVHGSEIFKFGNYSWKIDPFKRPWKIRCPVGGEEYPSNDFSAFLESGMTDRSLLIGNCPDDGWGWTDRKGERHWFIAYYCHWYWLSYLLPAVLDLSRLHLLTGEEKPARVSLILLERVARYYPAMSYREQSRYATEFLPDYDGKILNRIWETRTISRLAESIVNLRGFIGSARLNIGGKDGDALKAFLEDRILMEGLRCIKQGRISGNYGVHQEAMLMVLRALGREEETERWVDFLLNNSGGGYAHQGLRYAMDNFIYREGLSYENAPGYCFAWSRHLLAVAMHLESLGVPFPHPEKLRRMVEAPFRILCQGIFTPSIGDSGSVASKAILPSKVEIAAAYRMFGSRSLAKHLKPGFSSYEELFLPPLTRKELGDSRERRRRTRSDCLPGYGLVLLRGRGLECSLFYGRKNGHGHFDRLGIEIFGLRQKVSPDLGYPQFAAEAKDPPAWERNTVSHNTVVVDEKRQDTGCAGQLRIFHSGSRLQLAEASANRTYHETSVYDRTLAIVGKRNPFFIDVFRIRGGHAHDYSFHGQEGEFSYRGISLEGRKGTLAGEDVPYGFLYDDPELERADKKRSYYTYSGSGFSYLYDLRTGIPEGPWLAEWRGRKASLRIFFPHHADEVIVASGNPPLKPGNPRSLRYVLLRNRGPHLESVFTAVGEVFCDEPRIGAVRAVEVKGEGASMPVGVLVERRGVNYLILSCLEESEVKTRSVKAAGRYIVIASDEAGRPEEVFLAGKWLKWENMEVYLEDSLTGRISALDREANSVTVRGASDAPWEEAIGEMAFISNGVRSSCFRVTDVKRLGEDVVLELDGGGRIGRLEAERLGPKEIKTETELLFSDHGYYDGAYLVDAAGRSIRIKRAERNRIVLVAPLGEFSLPHCYVWEYAVGDRVHVEASLSMRRMGRRWVGRTNVPATIRIADKERSVRPGRFSFAVPEGGSSG